MALRLAGERYPSEGVFDTVTISDGAGHYLQVPKLTTAQRDALSPTSGMIIYNTTTGQFEWYQGGAWTGVIAQSLLTTQGDIIVKGVSAAERLAIGAKRFFPRVNEAGDGLEYVKGYEFGKALRMWQWELDFFEWTTTVTGSGSIDIQGYGLFQPSTGATAGSTARGRGFLFGWFPYDTDDFEWFAHYVHSTSTPNGRTWLKVDVDTAADPTDRAVGWRVDENALKGIVHDGNSLTAVDLDISMNAGDTKDLFLKFVHGDKVYWYVDSVEKGNSANIPTTIRENDVYPIFAVANGVDDAIHRAQLRRHGWIKGA